MEDFYKKYMKYDGKLDYNVLWDELSKIKGFMATKLREDHYHRIVEWFTQNGVPTSRKEKA